MKARTQDICQESEFSKSSLPDAASTFAKSQKPNALSKTVRSIPKMPAVLDVFCNNLMHPLSAQPKLISYLRQRLTTKTCHLYVLISGCLPTWTRRQRSPLPSWKQLQATDPIRRKFTFTVPLPCVINPIAKSQAFTVKSLDMNSRDYAVAFSKPELIQRTNVQKESLIMIHTVYNSRGNAYSQPCYGGGKHG